MLPNWKSTQNKFNAWWHNSISGAPLLWISAVRDTPSEALEPEKTFTDPSQCYLDVEELSLRYRNYMRTHEFYAQGFPNMDLNVGAGSLALYLGCKPHFAWDTVWFEPMIAEGWEGVPLASFDANAPWLQRHLEMIRRAVELSEGKYQVNIPDIVENLDILSALRGPQNMCFDLIDEPDAVKAQLDALDDIYFKYYDLFYDLTKMDDGSSTYTAFQIWGPGKTAKVQCDFAALISPDQFRHFVQPSLKAQTARLQQAVYHLDGPDEIRHLDALTEISTLNAIQWTHGAGHPDGLDPKWHEPIYDKVQKAGKSLLLFVEDGGIDDWIAGIDRLVNRYGTKGLYMIMPEMSQKDAERLISEAERRWGRVYE